MAWKDLKVKIRGDAPLLMHNGQTADPLNEFSKKLKAITGKKKKTDADYEEMARIEFNAGLYINGHGPFIPASNIEATIVNGAKKDKEGQLAKSGFYASEDSVLEYDGPRTREKLWGDKEFRFSSIVRIQSSRLSRTRPIFKEWGTTLHLKYDDSIINESQLRKWIDVSGSSVGLCEWRPRFGRFQEVK